jgi:citrate lyase beta subunit
MAKFLQVDTASNGKLVIPATDVVWVNTPGSPWTSTEVYLMNNGTLDVVTVTHAADSAAIVMIAYIQDKLVEAAQGKWSESFLNITDGSPLVISNVTIS